MFDPEVGVGKTSNLAVGVGKKTWYQIPLSELESKTAEVLLFQLKKLRGSVFELHNCAPTAEI